MNPSLSQIDPVWDASYMQKTPLQRFIADALSIAPAPRDHYDKLIQKKTGSSGKPLHDIERGKSKNPSVATLVNIAEVLRQPLDLLTKAAKGEDVAPINDWHNGTPDLPPIISASAGDGTIPLRKFDLGLSMGDGTNIDHYVEEETIEFDAGLLRTISRSSFEKLIVAEGVGNSMTPTIINGDMLVIDTSQKQLNLLDKIWAISLFGAGGVKRLRPVGGGRILVISDNPDLDNQEVDSGDLHILGRVVWSGRRH